MYSPVKITDAQTPVDHDNYEYSNRANEVNTYYTDYMYYRRVFPTADGGITYSNTDLIGMKIGKEQTKKLFETPNKK